MEFNYKKFIASRDTYRGYIECAARLGSAGEDDAHSRQVARLALQLFEGLHVLHGMNEEACLYLHLAALLHDIGYQEGHKGHHKSSLRIITRSPDLPYTDDEKLIIGSIARYHRKALPSAAHAHFKSLNPDNQDLVAKMGALLRLADGLDFSHEETVEKIRCKIEKDAIVLDCLLKIEDSYISSRIEKKQDLFLHVFGCRVRTELRLQP